MSCNRGDSQQVRQGLLAEQEIGGGMQCGHDGKSVITQDDVDTVTRLAGYAKGGEAELVNPEVGYMPDAGEVVELGPLPESGDAGQQAIDDAMFGQAQLGTAPD